MFQEVLQEKGEKQPGKSRKMRQLDVGEQLKAEFARTGMTRFELSKRSGVPYSTIHRFFGQGRDIALSTVVKICRALDLELRPVERRRK